MQGEIPSRLFRFGVFEADERTGELRRQGMRVKLNAQAFRTLLLLLENAGQLVTRESIQQQLWPEGTFVDFDHGLNSAMNRIRDALGDAAASPRYVETLPGRGYRFVAPVEIGPREPKGKQPHPVKQSAPTPAPAASAETGFTVLATPQELPQAPHRVVRALFLLLQLMYIAFYVGALANLGEIGDLLMALTSNPHTTLVILIVSAAVMLPVRLFLISAAAFRPPGLKTKFLKMFPLLLLLDELWALSPFLLLHHINFGLALAATAVLVYSPFAQRSLLLMLDRESRTV